jgi:Ca-activated chloride channel family protein
MSFIWPPMLVLAVLIPLGLLAYLAAERRRRRRLASYRLLATTGEPPSSAPRRRLRRRLPGALMLVGLAFLVIAMARPQAVISVPRVEGTVILAFDVSGSMAATDLAPTRMEAARRPPALRRATTVDRQDRGRRLQRQRSVRPGADDDPTQVAAAIDRLGPTRGTSIASGIQSALGVIAAADADPAAGYYTNRSPGPTVAPTPVPAGSHADAVVILLSDGENTTSPDPVAAAKFAADRGIRIFTVGIGSVAGTTIDVEGFKIHSQLDEDLLRQIAATTDGTYYAARDPDQLRTVYDAIQTRLVIRPEQTEITSFVAGAGLLILLIGGLASLRWLGRLP